MPSTPTENEIDQGTRKCAVSGPAVTLSPGPKPFSRSTSVTDGLRLDVIPETNGQAAFPVGDLPRRKRSAQGTLNPPPAGVGEITAVCPIVPPSAARGPTGVGTRAVRSTDVVVAAVMTTSSSPLPSPASSFPALNVSLLGSALLPPVDVSLPGSASLPPVDVSLLESAAPPPVDVSLLGSASLPPVDVSLLGSASPPPSMLLSAAFSFGAVCRISG